VQYSLIFSNYTTPRTGKEIMGHDPYLSCKPAKPGRNGQIARTDIY
jgi:hypothetical protein